MQYRSVTSLALVALATTATAQQSRVFTRASQSVREFDIFARQSDGYQPEDEICGGEGSTCAEACGAGYLECSSSDDSVHCYNPAQEESCCASGNGSSCLASFYCARDSGSGTFCCPGGSSLDQCATEFGVTGVLAVDAPAATSSSSIVSESRSEAVSSSSAIISSSVEVSSALPASEVISSSFYANSTSLPSYTTAVETTTTTETDSSATSDSTDGTDGDDDTKESGAGAHGPTMALIAAVAMLATLF